MNGDSGNMESTDILMGVYPNGTSENWLGVPNSVGSFMGVKPVGTLGSCWGVPWSSSPGCLTGVNLLQVSGFNWIKEIIVLYI